MFSDRRRFREHNVTSFVALLLLLLAGCAHEVRIAVGQSRAEAVALIEKHGGTDITPGLAVVGPNDEWPLHGLFWEFREYDAVIELAARDGKITAMSFWTKDDFGQHGKKHRYDVERPVTVLKLDKKTKRVSVEDKKDAG